MELPIMNVKNGYWDFIRGERKLVLTTNEDAS